MWLQVQAWMRARQGGGDLINVIKDPMFNISQVLSTAVFLLGLQ